MSQARRHGAVRTVLALVLVVAAVTGLAPDARAADEADIIDLQPTETGLEVTVDVPRGSNVDLAGVTASLDNADYPAAAQRLADGGAASTRTAILAIDTSRSMLRGTRIEDAKQAAKTFLEQVPDDVLVGIVSFSSEVVTVLEPSADRVRAAALIDGLELTLQTRLFDGVVAALDLAGDEGTRSVLVLSDGKDTTSTASIDDVQAAVSDSDVTVDVVALEQGASASDVLARIAGPRGTVIDSTSEDLAAEFAAEAQDLGRQVAVTIEASDDVLAGQVSVRVTLPTSGGELTDVALYQGEDAGPPPELPTAAPPVIDDTSLPTWVMYAAVALVFAALLVGLVTLVPAGRVVPRSPQARISRYTAGLVPGADTPKQDEPALTQATEAIAGVLRRNQRLDERISSRLLAAGSALRSSEWLLLHGSIALGALVVGLLLGRGTVVLGLLFLVLGVVLPWVYLGVRRSRRRRQFESRLPETLQLMSGSLLAGLSMVQAIDTIVREGADPVASEFRRVLVEIRLGIALDDALDGVAERFESRDFRWVVMAIRIQRQVGGNLAELLTTVSTTIREREYIRRQVSALAAEGKLSAVVLGCLPPGFLLYLVLAQPSYVAPLFTDLRGLIMLVGGAIWLGVGILWMSRLIRVEV